MFGYNTCGFVFCTQEEAIFTQSGEANQLNVCAPPKKFRKKGPTHIGTLCNVNYKLF